MNRLRILVVLLLAVPFSAYPKTRAATAPAPAGQTPLASGWVSSINPETHLIGIENDHIVIDATAASIRNNQTPTSFSAIKTGMQIALVLVPGSYGSGQPLPATIVQILNQTDGSITGAIEAVDLNNRTFKIQGQIIKVKDQTFMLGSISTLDPRKLEDLRVGMAVNVDFDGDITQLVAQRVYAIAPTPDSQAVYTAVLSRIDGNTWYVSQSPYITSFKITGATAINLRPPQIGFYITVLVRVDAGVNSAIDIEPASRPCGVECHPFPTVTLLGVLTDLTSTHVTLNEGKNIYDIAVTSDTLYELNPAVGDNVRVEAELVNGNLRATRVVKVIGPLSMTIIDTITAINDHAWTVGSFHVLITEATQVLGTFHVGDRARILGDRLATGDVTARVIDKP